MHGSDSPTRLIRQYICIDRIALRLDFGIVHCKCGIDLSTIFLCWNRFPDGVVLNHGVVIIRGGWSRVR